MKQRQRGCIAVNVSPPRKKWAAPAPPISLSQDSENTSTVKEGMQL